MTSGRDNSASSSSSSTSTNIEAPNIGWYGLIMNKRQELIAYSQETLIQLQRVSAQWQGHIPAIRAFISNVSHKLEILQRAHPNAHGQSTWSQFFNELNNCVDNLNKFSIILANNNNTTPQKIAAFGERLRSWPALIQAFNNLELDLIAKGLFSSFSAQAIELEHRTSNLSLKSILPPYHFQQLETSLKGLEEHLSKEFSRYPETMQDAILMSASKLNSLFRHAYLMIDKFAAQMDLETRKLVKEPLFDLNIAKNSKDEKDDTRANTLSFHELATRFRDAYATLMTQAGYDWHEEYYPFSTAILTQREAYPLELLHQEALEIQHADERWKDAQQECTIIIEAHILELQDEYANMWTPGNAKKENIAQLQRLITRLPVTETDIEQVILGCISTPGHDDVKAALNKIRAVYNNAVHRKSNRHNWFKNQNQNIQELIIEAKTDTQNRPAVIPHPLTMKEIIHVDAPTLVDHTKQLLATFVHSSTDVQSNETVFDNIINTLQQCELKFQEILDPTIYADLFLHDTVARFNIRFNFLDNENLLQTDIEVNTSWLFHIAQLMKNIKLLATEGNKLLAKSQVNSKLGTTPSMHFQGSVRQLDTMVVTLTALMKKFNAFRDHPVIKELPPIGTLLGMAIPTIQDKFQQTLVAPLSNHPLQEAWNDRNDFAAEKDKLEGGLQILRRILLSLLDKSAKDPAMKQIANRGLEQADELLAEFQNTQSVMAFLFNRPVQLYKFIRSVADIFSSLMTLSGDQLLLAAKQMNDALRQLFLLLNRLEIQFYLKENYFAKLISINGQSLLELGKLFSDSLKDQGYVFKSEECFPYAEAILTAQRNLLSTLNHADSATKRFINTRMTQSLNEIDAGKLQVLNKLTANKALFKTDALQKLELRRRALIEKNAGCIASSAKTKTADLLQTLITAFRNSDSIHLQLGMFSQDEKDLLWKGKTGKLLKSLLFYTKENFIADVQNVGEKLKHQKQHAWGLFASAATFQKKIDAIEAFKNWLVLPGYRIEDALKELKETNLSAYQILDKHKKELIDPLREFEKYIPDFLIGKKIIGQTGVVNNLVSPSVSDPSLPAHERLFNEEDAPANLLQQPLLLAR